MSVNGIYGLSGSGLDIESMVKVGMMSKQSQYEKMQQTYTLNEWKKEAFLDVYDKLQTYNTSTLSTFKMSNNMNARNATSSNSAITATANSSAPTMNHTITVNSTATNAYLVGTNELTKDLHTFLGVIDTAEITFKITDSVSSDSIAAATFSGTDNAKLDEDLMSNALLSALVGSGQTGTALTGVKTYGTGTDATVRFTYDALYTKNSELTESSGSEYRAASSDAMVFSVSDGNNSSDVKITYGDIAKLFVEPDYEFSFTDFVSLLNEKMENAGLSGVTATYSAEDNGSLTFNNYNNGGKVSATLKNGAGDVGNAILKSLGSTETVVSGSTSTISAKALIATSNSVSSTTLGTSTEVYLKVNSETTYFDLASAINNKGTNIRATYDSVNGTFAMYNMKSGSNNIVGIDLSIANNATAAQEDAQLNAAKVLNAMGLVQSKGTTSSDNPLKFLNNGGTAVSKTSAVIAGTDASVVLDGVAYTKDSNTFTEKGVTYNFANVTEKTTSNISVTQDVEKIVENVKSFVESYNTMLSDLYDAYNEKPNSSYKPLTEAQKAEMTEDQIKKWEEKAKSGMLYHDSTIRKIIDNMRSAISTDVDSIKGSAYTNGYSIGLSTTGIYGQLTLNEDKLRAALSADADSVYNVFAKLDSTTTESGAAYSSSEGIAQRLGDIMTNGLKSITSVAGRSSDINEDSQLNNLMRNLQTKMSSFRSMMDAFENALYKKYDAMESTLAMLGTQLNYVTSSFA